MTIQKQTTIDMVEVTKNKAVQLRIKTIVLENGNQIGGSTTAKVIAPGDDYSAENDRTKAICAAVHTPEAIAAYNAS